VVVFGHDLRCNWGVSAVVAAPLKGMNDDERRKAREVAAVVRQEVLQPVDEHGGRNAGIVNLPAFDGKSLDQFAELFGNQPAIFQNVKLRPERGHIPKNSRVIRRGNLPQGWSSGHCQLLPQDLNTDVKIGSLLAPLLQFRFGCGLKRRSGVSGEDQNVRINE
jgi:hypothetical protein